MSRTVPAQLQAHLDTGRTTTTLLLKITPAMPGYPPVGVTALDRDVPYDDGEGDSEVIYHAAVGMVPAALQQSLSMSVDNTEFKHLISEYGLALEEADIAAGVYDYAEFRLMLVNYEDLTMGHVELMRGELGQMRIEQGMAFWTEQTSMVKRLKQSIVEKDSLTCRAIFGSQPIGSSNDGVQQRFPCGFDTSALWTAGVVTSVGLESNRTFTAAALGLGEGECVPGMLRWTVGANAGRSCEVEAQSAAGVVSLAFETMFPIEEADEFEIRPDCTKWKDGANGCRHHFGDDWVLHYRGEPYIPVADADALNTPGATVGTGVQ